MRKMCAGLRYITISLKGMVRVHRVWLGASEEAAVAAAAAAAALERASDWIIRQA